MTSNYSKTLHGPYGSKVSAPDYYGRKIRGASLKNEEILITFEDGKAIKITDEGQSCCESRYMRTDDNLSDLVGKVLNRIEIKEVKDCDIEDCNHEVHEIAFLEIQADHEAISVTSHVDSNGYYGGFDICLVECGAK